MNFKPTSILGFGVAISLMAYFGGIYSAIPRLTEAAAPFVKLFIGIWLIFIALTVIRNVASGI